MRHSRGVTLVELLMTVGILAIVFGTSGMLFSSALAYWKIADARTDLQQKLTWSIQKISLELLESGFDSIGQIQAAVLDNTGSDGTDVLRFAIPLCLCGTSPIDENGDVSNWGAPLLWGQSGCQDPWPVANNGKVTVCHFPPGNPANMQTLSVSQNAVKAHLAHGDWINDCNSCTLPSYSNRLIQYSRDAGRQLIRNVLDQNNASIAQSVTADELQDFQVTLDAVAGTATLNMTFSRTLAGGRQITVTGALDVVLRNRG